MIRVKPLGINTKGTDRDVKDGFMLECVNLQKREGAVRPIPNRISTGIDVGSYSKIIFHKVGDEDVINVLGFSDVDNNYLASDLTYLLGGGLSSDGYLKWYGTITNGFYAPKATPVTIPLKATDGMTWTILNGLIYFMGDGSDLNEEYFVRLQYNEVTETYEKKNMYQWKELVPYFPNPSTKGIVAPVAAYSLATYCGMISIRFALVLKSGEVVMHSPIYSYLLMGINYGDEVIPAGTTIENIHTFINLDLEFENGTLLYDTEVSAINVYACVPWYETKTPQATATNADSSDVYVGTNVIRGKAQDQANSTFHLIKTIKEPTSSEELLLTVGDFDPSFALLTKYYRIDISSVAAGEVMPVDNFSYHYVYGTITSYNGRLIVSNPTTKLSGNFIRSLATVKINIYSGFEIDTEDGVLTGAGYPTDARPYVGSPGDSNHAICRGIMSYPDFRATEINFTPATVPSAFYFKVSRVENKNIACNLDIGDVEIAELVTSPQTVQTSYKINYKYTEDKYEAYDINLDDAGYDSLNRVQFSEAGEFSVWPVENSYRVGEGKILRVGANNVNPSGADIVTPLIIGTTDGVYTINLDPTGNNLVASITRIAKVPFISSEILQINTAVVFVSDKGLMVVDNDNPINLTEDFFPDQGNGDYPTNETVIPNYNLLTQAYYGGSGNLYTMTDVVQYLKGAILAYDNRRNSIWCSNPNYNYSMVYNIKDKMWSLCSLVFNERIDLFNTMQTDDGDVYSWYAIREKSMIQTELLILSAEDLNTEVVYHMLTRPIKLNQEDVYKKIERLYSRCELLRDSGGTGYFSFGVWGKQDLNKFKKQIPIIALSTGLASAYPNDVRQDIPVGSRKGKFKSFTILQGGKTLPDSSIDSFDFDVKLIDNVRPR